ncbi:phage terminase large subunit [Phosphitispora fastidiosa]|uniref:phage terminase large subunit n=1 Tax=Phosphitispora fastidiosa TaxID=2837202 RepID=UPI001E349F29|nr:phage terminase large subunit [Phosphitispora fastidiosa]MBU7006318.1 hypothetical protein [Phosphitispora fastidiosa]
MALPQSEVRVSVPYKANKRQEVFHSCPAEEAVYGGAKGGGKSCGLVMEALAYALEYPGAEMYLFRETYDDLEANIIKEWKEKVPKELYSYNEGKHVVTVYNGTKIKFRFIRNKSDAARYDGRSMDWVGVDELTKHEEESIQILLSCLRSPKGFPARFRGTCNPGNIGHMWVKKRYISATNYGKDLARDPVTKNRIAFIPAKVYDNEVLMKNDPNYVKRLENLPKDKRKAYLFGDWDIYEGMAFEEFSHDIHVCKPFPIPAHWRRWRSLDNGYADPFAWYWFAVSEDGIVYIYREYTRDYNAPKVIYSDQARKVVDLSKRLDIDDIGQEIWVPEKIDFTVAGHDAWQTHVRDESGKTLIDYYQDGGVFGFIRPITDRKFRKAVWHEYLKPYYDEVTKKMTAKVQIFDTCKFLVEYLPMQIEDEKDSEKVAETSIDHWYDGAGYGLIAYHVQYTKPPKEEEPPIARHKNQLAKRRRHTTRRMS